MSKWKHSPLLFGQSKGMTKKAVTNWTSTRVPLWETDCLQFWRAGLPFELRDVTTEGHFLFVARFAKAHELEVQLEGNAVVFRHPEK